MVSSGGVDSGTSLPRSPVVVLVAAALDAPPKSVDILLRFAAEDFAACNCRVHEGWVVWESLSIWTATKVGR